MSNLRTFIQFADIIAMIALIIVIALQNKSAGLSNVFGGTGSIAQTRRGFEKWLFYATIIFGLAFAILSISLLFVK